MATDVCVSNIVPFVPATDATGSIAIIQPTNWPCQTTFSPAPLTIQVFKFNDSQYNIEIYVNRDLFFIFYSYQIIMGSDGSVQGEFKDNNNINAGWYPTSDDRIGVTGTACGNIPKASYTQITLTEEFSNAFPIKIGDNYVINVSACSGSSSNNLQVTLNRPAGKGISMSNINSNMTSSDCSGCECFTTGTCGNINVPIVSILGRTTMDGSNLGEMNFTICDKFTYYEEELLSSKCGVFYIKTDQVKQTQFRQCCPPMELVVKGKGVTLDEKLRSIYFPNQDKFTISYDTFEGNMILYGMAKYILSRILYGIFNINFLLGKYNTQFLKDLGKSRFCGAIQLFEDCNSPVYGYNQYFKFNKYG